MWKSFRNLFATQKLKKIQKLTIKKRINREFEEVFENQKNN